MASLSNNSLMELSFVATYLTTGQQKKVMAFSSPMKNTYGSRHQHLFEENVRKTKKWSVDFENKGSDVVYAWRRY